MSVNKHIRSNTRFAKQAYKRQRGVAIITALLIVTIATTVSITIATRLQLDVRRTSNIIALDQVDFFLLEAEEWSQRILQKDQKDSTTDDLTEDWAINIPPLPVDGGGTIQGSLTDLHACININTLVDNGAINTVTEAQLTRLFTNLGITTNLTTAIADWIDNDLDTPNSNGAEDGYYMNLEKPYRTANSKLVSVTELRLIKGFDEKIGSDENTVYQLVSPYLCAYNASNNAPLINVNTASAEVLQSLAAGMTSTLVESIIEQREETPFTSKENFTSFSNLKTIITDTGQITVSSEYFLLRSQAIIGPANKVMYSVIFRNTTNGATEIISRTQRTL